MIAPYVAYKAAGQQTDFVVPFPFINRSHVKVKVNGSFRQVALWPQSNKLRILPAFANDFVEIYRDTPMDGPLVDFQNGAVLTSEDLNTAILQLLYRQQEVSGLYDRTLGAAQVRLADLNGIPVPPEGVMDQLVYELLASQALAEFNARVGELDGLATAIVAEAVARVDAVRELADSVDSRVAELTNLTGDIDAAVVAERSARIDGDTAIANDVLAMATRVNDAEANILIERTARSDADSALATSIEGLTATVDGANAAIVAEQEARADADGALATSISGLVARTDDAEAAIVAEQTARANADGALSTSLGLLSARTDGAEAAIVSEQEARATADSALASSIGVINVEVEGAKSRILDIERVSIADDEAAAELTLGAIVEAANARAARVVESTVRATEDAALARSYDALGVRVNTNEAAIITEQTARADADATLSTRLDVITSRVGAAEANIVTEQTTRATADTALAEQNNALTTRMGAAEAAIITEQNTRSSADSAMASSVSALVTRMGNAEGSITTAQSAIATAQSDISGAQTSIGGLQTGLSGAQSSINSLQLRYSVTLNSNGHITGFTQNNNGTFGSFKVVADKFFVVTPDGTEEKAPFAVSEGLVKINGNLVVTGSITSGAIAQNAVTMPVSAFTAAGVTVASNTWTTVQSLTITTTGGPVLVAAFFQYEVSTGSTLEYYRTKARVLRDGVEIFGMGSSAMRLTGGGAVPAPVGFSVTDVPGAGAHTYEVQFQTPKNGDPVINRSLVCVEMRR